MKGWKIIDQKTLEEREINSSLEGNTISKVKITKSLITLSDVLRFSGESEHENVVLGSYGIGVISETDANLLGIEKGEHVYIEPNRPCEKCFNCINGQVAKCSDLLIAGEDFDGFLCDFTATDSNNLYVLPESVTDKQALFIGHISKAVSVVDKLNIQKGDYVAIIGANNFGIILAQILIYYQAVPIILTTDEEDLKTAKDSGIYYALGPNDNWQKEVSSITGGRLAKCGVYIADCNIPASKAFALVSFGAHVAFTGESFKNATITFTQAVKKQLRIHCINRGVGNTAAAINLIANKAIDLSHLNIKEVTYADVPNTFNELYKQLTEKEKVYETIVNLI